MAAALGRDAILAPCSAPARWSPSSKTGTSPFPGRCPPMSCGPAGRGSGPGLAPHGVTEEPGTWTEPVVRIACPEGGPFAEAGTRPGPVGGLRPAHRGRALVASAWCGRHHSGPLPEPGRPRRRGLAPRGQLPARRAAAGQRQLAGPRAAGAVPVQRRRRGQRADPDPSRIAPSTPPGCSPRPGTRGCPGSRRRPRRRTRARAGPPRSPPPAATCSCAIRFWFTPPRGRTGDGLPGSWRSRAWPCTPSSRWPPRSARSSRRSWPA